MRGRLISFDANKRTGFVDAGQDNLRHLKIFFKDIPSGLRYDSTIEFELKKSCIGNDYGVFLKVVERNRTIFNTEKRNAWYEWGENEELDFINNVVPRLDVVLEINSKKKDKPWEIDLYDRTNNRFADLKTQNTPFFSAGSFLHEKRNYDPAYTVTFNRKDYLNYRKHYPNCIIYYWVNWTQTEYQKMRVEHIHGVWRAEFSIMAEYIDTERVYLHQYLNRKNDNFNARDSYLFDLTDINVFERLI